MSLLNSFCSCFRILLNCLCFLVAHWVSLRQLFCILYLLSRRSPCLCVQYQIIGSVMCPWFIMFFWVFVLLSSHLKQQSFPLVCTKCSLQCISLSLFFFFWLQWSMGISPLQTWTSTKALCFVSDCLSQCSLRSTRSWSRKAENGLCVTARTTVRIKVCLPVTWHRIRLLLGPLTYDARIHSSLKGTSAHGCMLTFLLLRWGGGRQNWGMSMALSY